jgi:hypothetical protein
MNSCPSPTGDGDTAKGEPGTGVKAPVCTSALNPEMLFDLRLATYTVGPLATIAIADGLDPVAGWGPGTVVNAPVLESI